MAKKYRDQRDQRGGPPSGLSLSVEQRLARMVPRQSDEQWASVQAAFETQRAAHAREHHLERVQGIKDHVRKALIAGAPMLPTEALTVVRGWHASWPNATSRPALVIAGKTGVGKSVAGQWLIAQAGGTAWSAERASKAYASKFGPELEQLMAALLAPLFVLEDVGTEQDDIVLGAFMVQLLEQRQSGRLRTLITCNLAKLLFWSSYRDARLHSRLSEVQWRVVEGDDLRASGRTSQPPAPAPPPPSAAADKADKKRGEP